MDQGTSGRPTAREIVDRIYERFDEGPDVVSNEARDITEVLGSTLGQVIAPLWEAINALADEIDRLRGE
jgi:hypothetical protein